MKNKSPLMRKLRKYADKFFKLFDECKSIDLGLRKDRIILTIKTFDDDEYIIIIPIRELNTWYVRKHIKMLKNEYFI